MADDATLKLGIEGNASGADAIAGGLSKITSGLAGVAAASNATTAAAGAGDAAFKARIENFEAELAAQKAAQEERRLAQEEDRRAEQEEQDAQRRAITSQGLVQESLTAFSMFRERLSTIEAGWNSIKEAAEKAAEGSGGFANVTVSRMGNVSKAIDDLKGGFSSFLGRLLDPDNTAGKFTDSLRSGLDTVGVELEILDGKMRRIMQGIRDAAREAADANRLTDEVASNEERRLQLFRRQQIAAVDPNASGEDQAKAKADIEIKFLEELGKIKDEKARQQALSEERIARKKLEGVNELEEQIAMLRQARELTDFSARNAVTEADKEKAKKASEYSLALEKTKQEEIKRLRDEAEQSQTKAAEILSNRRRTASTEAEERTTVGKEQGNVISQARAADVAKAEAEAARAKAEQERAARDAARQTKGEPDTATLPGGAFAGVGASGRELAGKQSGTAQAAALQEALKGLENGGDAAEIGGVIDAVKQLGETLRGRSYKREFDALKRELEQLRDSVKQDRD
jgi:hypothetical protein